jgi:hypothetical protein
MKPVLFALTLLFACDALAANPPAAANAPTIMNLRDFPVTHLRTNISPKLYKSLSISPVTAWVVAQAPSVAGAEPRIVRSDAGGMFDKVALAMAKDWGTVGYNTTESRTQPPLLNVHLLVYKIADGYTAVNFSHNDQAFHAGRQHTDVWVGVWKDGKWTRVGGTKVTREYRVDYH